MFQKIQVLTKTYPYKIILYRIFSKRNCPMVVYLFFVCLPLRPISLSIPSPPTIKLIVLLSVVSSQNYGEFLQLLLKCDVYFIRIRSISCSSSSVIFSFIKNCCMCVTEIKKDFLLSLSSSCKDCNQHTFIHLSPHIFHRNRCFNTII